MLVEKLNDIFKMFINTDLIYKVAQYFSIPNYSGTGRHLPNPTAQKLTEISATTHWTKIKFLLV